MYLPAPIEPSAVPVPPKGGTLTPALLPSVVVVLVLPVATEGCVGVPSREVVGFWTPIDDELVVVPNEGGGF